MGYGGRWTRRELLSAGVALGACSRSGPRERRPNILFALADDQSYPHASGLGDPVAQTPVFDRVAGEGVLFTHSFACCPSCTPSRSSVLTGRQMWEVEQAGVLYGTLPARFPIVTHILADAGYHAGFTGKPWGPGNWRAGGLTRHPNGAEYNRRRFSEPVAGGIDLRDYAANFDDFLADRPDESPFFFWFGCTEPHRVYRPGIGLSSGKRLEDVKVPSFWPDTEEIRSDILDYYYEVEWFDRQLGRMLERLEERGELENTLVVVTSDNGMPFPRAKVNLYDWGVRMPLAIRWGDRVAGGSISGELVSHVDFAPTFLQAAGIEPPASFAGQSLLPLLQGDKGRRSHILTGLERHTWCRPGGATYPIRAIRSREHLYIRNFEADRWPTGGPEFVSSNKTFHGDVDACPTKSFLIENRERYPREYDLCFGKRPAEELYDTGADPGQVRNLATDADHAELKGRLRRVLEEDLRRSGDPRIEGRDPWQDYIYHQTIGFGATFNRSLSEEERRRARERSAHKPE